MSRIAKESRIEAKKLFKLGLISEEEYSKMMMLTVRDKIVPPPSNYDGGRIVEIRKRLGYSQALFAIAVGVTAGTISKWERDQSHPDKTASRLLDAIEVLGDKAILC